MIGREAISRALCRAEGTAQCASLCLQHFASCTRDGKCPEAVRVWGRRADAVLALARPGRAAVWADAISIAQSVGAPDSAYYTGDTARVRIYGEATDRVVQKLEEARDSEADL